MRNEKGQFVVTTGSTRYKNQQLKGHRMGEHKKKMCVALGITNFSTEFIVHHIDGNKKNNDIDNLSIMTITAHNRIHSHPAWNKGLRGDIRSKDIANKAWKKRYEKLMPVYKDTYELKQDGKKLKEISEIMGVCERQVCGRLKFYKQQLAEVHQC